MINLNNDVLNEDRRKLFPKIHTMSNKFSFNTMTLLKKQKPFNYYRSFCHKYIEKQKRNKLHFKESKSPVDSLAILSKTRNFYFSLPIQFDSSFINNISKNEQNLELNKFQKEFYSRNKSNLLYEDSQINYIDFSRHKTLRTLHMSLMGGKKYSGESMDRIGIKKGKIKLLRIQKRSKSCIDAQIRNVIENKNEIEIKNEIKNEGEKEIIKKNFVRYNFNKRLKSRNYVEKKSQEQQTIDSELTNNIGKNKNELKITKVYIESSKHSYPKVEHKEEENKLNIKFLKPKNLNIRAINQNNKNDNVNNVGEKFKVKVFWSNLRRPLIFNSLLDSTKKVKYYK